jgi:hypothetical protein
MPQCRLCHRPESLRDSHIVPEFLYRPLRNEKQQMSGINGRGRLGRRLIQRGLSEHLLCEACEQLLSNRYETPFLRSWLEAPALPRRSEPGRTHSITVDYQSFKLFHLSVLFRASVSSLTSFAPVSLGPHEERLRERILRGEPGEDWEYPIAGSLVVHDRTKEVLHIVGMPRQYRLGPQRIYTFLYGGVDWQFGVSAHRNDYFGERALKRSGRLTLRAVPWNSLPIMQEAAQALRGSDA